MKSKSENCGDVEDDEEPFLQTKDAGDERFPVGIEGDGGRFEIFVSDVDDIPDFIDEE